MILGILGLICCGPFAAIPAVICGHKARGRMRQTGSKVGDGQSLAGLILGYVSLALCVVMIPMQAAILLPAVAKARDAAGASACANNLRQLEMAKAQYGVDHNGELPARLEDLSSLLGSGKAPVCPRQGVYELGDTTTAPRCSVHGTAEEAMPRRDPRKSRSAEKSD
jgi:hypothetical protein